VLETHERSILTTDYHVVGFFYPFSNNGDGRVRCYDDARRRSSIVALVQRFFLFSPLRSHVLSTDYTYTYAIGSFIFILIVPRSLLGRGAEKRESEKA
jgi:hypothetical protein